MANPKLTIVPVTAERAPLPEPFTVEVKRGTTRWRAQCPAQCMAVEFKGLRFGDLYQVRVDSENFYGVETLFLRADETVPVFSQLKREAILAMHPVDYDQLDERMKGLLTGKRSMKTAGDGEKCNQSSRSDSPERCLLHRRILENELRVNILPRRTLAEEELARNTYLSLRGKILAGLLNLYAKMRSVEVLGGSMEGRGTVWDYFEELDCIEQDRVHGSVDPTLFTRVPDAKWFRPASGSDHKAPECHTRRGSLKTKEYFGNLQLTFFESVSGSGGMKVDADVDDAAGIAHAGQYLRNKKFFLSVLPFIDEGRTDPYEIHQILIYCHGRPENNLEDVANGHFHRVDPSYRLEYRSAGRTRFLPERLRS